MKSSIKVDYASIYDSGLGEREPIVRVELFQSDDPRDTLLNCIFKPDVVIGVQKREIETPERKETYVIYVKNRFTQVCELLSPVFTALASIYPDINRLIMVTSSEEIYFEKEPTDKKEQRRRSKGLDRYKLNGMKDLDIIKTATTDFTDFIKQISPSKK